MTTVVTTPAKARTQPARRSEAGIPFTRLLRVEWGKATDTRAARWLLLLVAVATAGLMLAPLLARHSVDQTQTNYLDFAALGLSMLLPVVAILMLTSEWTQRTVLTTFTQEPRRIRVVNAKVTVSVLLALLGSAFGGLVTLAAILIAQASGRTVTADLHTSQAIGFVLYVLLNVLIGVALGAVLHNTAAAIVLFFVLPTAFGFLSSAIKSVGNWIDPARTGDWVQAGQWSGHVGQIIVVTALWVVLPLAAGMFRTVRREIK